MTDRRQAEELLNRLTEDIRNEALDDEVVQQITTRSWARIADRLGDVAEHRALTCCGDYQSLIPAFIRGALTEARATLVRDHTRECVACRRELIRQRGGTPAVARPLFSPGLHASRRARLMAAAALIVCALTLGYHTSANVIADRNLTASVQAVDGELYLMAGEDTHPLATGEAIRARQTIRTGKGSGAMIALDDGSLIELNERSEIMLRGTRRGDRIVLDRGNIIVHAAPQDAGHLWVATEDCTVAVKGTIFAVDHGIKGSRVSVIEGSVEVRQATRHRALLKPGDQLTTDDRLQRLSIEKQLAWSRNAEQHLALLHELSQLRREIGRAVQLADHRTSTRLLDISPADTVLYAAIPNLAAGAVDARRVFEERLRTSPILAQWWQDAVVDTGVEGHIEDLFDRLQPVADALGDELALAVPASVFAQQGGPVLLAKLDDAPAFRSVLVNEIGRLGAQSPDHGLVLVDDPHTAQGVASCWLWVTEDLFVASSDLAQLTSVAEVIEGLRDGFGGATLYQELADAYGRGVEWLLGLDLQRIIAQTEAGSGNERELLEQLGLSDVTTLVLERHTRGEVASTDAVLSFDGPRRGMMGWLAEPAPMGSLDFVSQEASLAGAVVAKDAATMFDELIQMLATAAPEAVATLERFESTSGFDLRQDLAATIGGEAAWALDGPFLPTPAWKVILEVYDPQTLQATLERAITELNQELGRHEQPQLALTHSSFGGVDYVTIRHDAIGDLLTYAIVDGYLIAAPRQSLVERALAYRSSGLTLSQAPQLRALLPANQYSDCSALVYRNLEAVARNLPADLLSNLPGELMGLLDEGLAPSLYCAYGEPDRIVISGTGGSLLSMAPLLGVASLFEPPDEADAVVPEGVSS
jgi:hypothetical protein